NGRDREYRYRLVGLKQLEHSEDELRRQAAEDFAALNGRRCSCSRWSKPYCALVCMLAMGKLEFMSPRQARPSSVALPCCSRPACFSPASPSRADCATFVAPHRWMNL